MQSAKEFIDKPSDTWKTIIVKENMFFLSFSATDSWLHDACIMV